MKDEALRLALKALRFARDDGYENEVSQEAITAIKAALEAKDEPDYKALWQQMCERCDELDKKLTQRKPLTRDDLWRLWCNAKAESEYLFWWEFARAIEAAHGIKGEAK